MFEKIRLAVQAALELGFARVGQYALYQAGLKSGFYRMRTPARSYPPENAPAVRLDLLRLPDPELIRRLLAGRQAEVIAAADEIAAGKVRLFGGDAVPLDLASPGELRHWSRMRVPHEDIKLVWEPARFGWVFELARAYWLTQDERYPAVFWERWEDFTAKNPANLGANWESAQEVALRLITLSLAAGLFQKSPQSTADRLARLSANLIDHARRIPPTLIYARAQNNNHLVSEAAGLYIAGSLLENHPEAAQWKRLGWLWFNRSLQSQIEDDGEYIQHSTNYHRMVLLIALLVSKIAQQNNEYLPSATLERLGAATRWLLGHFDASSGRASNLGHNDGANPLPLAASKFEDYRPVVQAASLAFLGRPALPPGAWDECALWLSLPAGIPATMSSGAAWRIDHSGEWASLRARRYASRPAHADQLHVDLWHNGNNILLDPGTYSYNQAPPWQNGLAYTRVHNTITIDGLDQMQRASRFLWLRWAQADRLAAETLPGQRLTAFHDGYAGIGLRHQRSLEWIKAGHWMVTDEVQIIRSHAFGSHQVVLHWLLPQGEWQLGGSQLALQISNTLVTLSVNWHGEGIIDDWQRLVCAGEIISGPPGESETLGWYSPTYGKRIPALSFQTGLNCTQPLTITTDIKLETVP